MAGLQPANIGKGNEKHGKKQIKRHFHRTIAAKINPGSFFAIGVEYGNSLFQKNQLRLPKMRSK